MSSKGVTWLCCLNGERSLPAERLKEAKELIAAKLLVPIGKNNYLGVYEGWSALIPPSQIDANLIRKDMNTWVKIFENPIIRRSCCGIKEIEWLFNDAETGNTYAWHFPILLAFWLAIEARAPEIANSLTVGGVMNAIPNSRITLPRGLSLNYYPIIHIKLQGEKEANPAGYQELMNLVRSTYYSHLASASGLSILSAAKGRWGQVQDLTKRLRGMFK